MISIFLDRKYDSARRWSNQELKKIAKHFRGEIANVSAWDDRDKEGGYYRGYFEQATSYSLTNFPGYRGFAGRPGEIELDLTAELPAELVRRFDVVFNHTTLEHIFEIKAAFANLCTMSQGAVIVVVPFSQVQHESDDWGDYWRMTPTCLRAMFTENGFEVVYEAESPGRKGAVYLLFVGSRSPANLRARLPEFRRIEIAGSWIGASVLVSTYQFIRNRVRIALGRTENR